MTVPDAMPFKEFWFELEDGSYMHLPPHMARQAMFYGLSDYEMRFEEENAFFQFLLNSGHVWSWSPKVQERCTELIRTGRVKFFTEAHLN